MRANHSDRIRGGILALVVLVAGGVLPAQAEEYKCKMVSKMTKVDVNKIEDYDGHLVGIYERKGIMIFENGETAQESNHGWFDGTQTASIWQGYCHQAFKDGSTLVIKYQGRDENDRILECTFEFIKGTGRFEGIKGKGILTGSFNGDFEYSSLTGTYTVKK